MPRKNKKMFKIFRRHKLATLAAVAIAAVGGVLAWHRSNPASSVNQPATTPVAATIAQGGAVDKKGGSVAATPSSAWVSSASGLITVYSPTNESTLRSGDIISGSAKVSTIQYRLVDNQVGVLAQGDLSVVNGKFSGSLQFRAHSSAGVLDIFSFDSTGREVNSIKISLKLGT